MPNQILFLYWRQSWRSEFLTRIDCSVASSQNLRVRSTCTSTMTSYSLSNNPTSCIFMVVIYPNWTLYFAILSHYNHSMHKILSTIFRILCFISLLALYIFFLFSLQFCWIAHPRFNILVHRLPHSRRQLPFTQRLQQWAEVPMCLFVRATTSSSPVSPLVGAARL